MKSKNIIFEKINSTITTILIFSLQEHPICIFDFVKKIFVGNLDKDCHGKQRLLPPDAIMEVPERIFSRNGILLFFQNYHAFCSFCLFFHVFCFEILFLNFFLF